MELAFYTEIAAMKEDGLISDYWQYLALPERVKVGWRLWAANRNPQQQPIDASKMSASQLRSMLSGNRVQQ